MKRFVVGLLFAVAVAPWFSCEAGDGSSTVEKKNSKSSISTQQRTQITRQKRVAQTRTHHAGFCQDYYCVRAAASPWWPNAPGD